MFKKLPRILVPLAAVTLAFGSASLLPPAANADNREEITGACSAYTNEQLWQTSLRWARARERVCYEENSKREIRAVVQFQVDWPTNCSLSVGLPPQVGAGCPIDATMKRASLSMRNVEMAFTYRLPGGREKNASCKFSDRWNTENYGSNLTKSCRTTWHPWAKGDLRMTIDKMQVDVIDDGDISKELLPISNTFYIN
ncbi:hypothetical protein [Nocardia sp. XZ_19_385]|uniref:hypothetical protein n=1 Tax=Nocardia sp. XZ_19_385 TaxID=2769488 RepID=UPI00188DCCD1|nr:hypothetical protein [Nocardia sp. XZ_19_385]